MMMVVKKREKKESISKKLKARGLFLYKKRGQNFLMDPSMLEKIVNVVGINGSDFVVEIGAGSGNLTEVLARHAGFVVAMEVDKGVYEVLCETLGHLPNVEILLQDGLKVDYFSFLNRSKGPYRIVANLPFNISTPILFHLISQRRAFHSVYLTFQKELAKRIVAGPSTKDYSALSVMTQAYMNPKIVLSIPGSCFFPRPKVDAALVQFLIPPEPSVPISDPELFTSVVRAAFRQRRKMLSNALESEPTLGLTISQLKKAFNMASIDSKRRGESLELMEFSLLTDAIDHIRHE